MAASIGKSAATPGKPVNSNHKKTDKRNQKSKTQELNNAINKLAIHDAVGVDPLEKGTAVMEKLLTNRRIQEARRVTKEQLTLHATIKLAYLLGRFKKEPESNINTEVNHFIKKYVNAAFVNKTKTLGDDKKREFMKVFGIGELKDWVVQNKLYKTVGNKTLSNNEKAKRLLKYLTQKNPLASYSSSRNGLLELSGMSDTDIREVLMSGNDYPFTFYKSSHSKDQALQKAIALVRKAADTSQNADRSRILAVIAMLGLGSSLTVGLMNHVVRALEPSVGSNPKRAGNKSTFPRQITQPKANGTHGTQPNANGTHGTQPNANRKQRPNGQHSNASGKRSNTNKQPNASGKKSNDNRSQTASGHQATPLPVKK